MRTWPAYCVKRRKHGAPEPEYVIVTIDLERAREFAKEKSQPAKYVECCDIWQYNYDLEVWEHRESYQNGERVL